MRTDDDHIHGDHANDDFSSEQTIEEEQAERTWQSDPLPFTASFYFLYLPNGQFLSGSIETDSKPIWRGTQWTVMIGRRVA